MAIPIQEIEAGALTALAAVITQNSAAVEAAITSGESDIEGAIANLIKSIPSVKGALALVVGPIEGAVEAGIEAYVASVIAKYPASALVALVVSALQAEAKKVAA